MALYPSESEKINMKSIFQKITIQKVVKGLRYLKHYGWKEFVIRLQEKMEAENVPYEPWYEKHKAAADQLEKQKKQAEKEALDPDANYTEDKGNFEIPVEDEPEEAGEEDTAEE